MVHLYTFGNLQQQTKNAFFFVSLSSEILIQTTWWLFKGSVEAPADRRLHCADQTVVQVVLFLLGISASPPTVLSSRVVSWSPIHRCLPPTRCIS